MDLAHFDALRAAGKARVGGRDPAAPSIVERIVPKSIPVTQNAKAPNYIKNPPPQVSVDVSWVETLQLEGQQRFDRFMAQRPGLGISTDLRPNLHPGIKAYQTAISRG